MKSEIFDIICHYSLAGSAAYKVARAKSVLFTYDVIKNFKESERADQSG